MKPENSSFDVEALLALPRISGLTLSLDGSRLVASVSRPDKEGTRFVSALYEFDPDGEREPRRLTRSAAGESGARFAPDGSILFTSRRPDPDADAEEPERSALWLLPAGGGEARVVAAPPGGVDAFAVARESGSVVLATGSHPHTGGPEEDAEKEKRRKEAGVGAQLFTGYPIRLWDHYLGPRERHLRFIPRPEEGGEGEDLIPTPGRSLDLAAFDLTPDGSTLVSTSWREGSADLVMDLLAVDTGSGETRYLSDPGEDASYSVPSCSPDGRYVAAVRGGISTPERVAGATLWLVDLEAGEGRDLLDGFDLSPGEPVWTPGSEALLFTADEDGNTPVFRVEIAGGEVSRLAAGGSFDPPRPSPDGRTVYSVRSAVTEPPRPVALDDGAAPRLLPAFEELESLELPGRLERVTAKAADGTPVRSWLVLPPGASAEEPAPLATLIHGGPVGSWNGWHWRWNPNVLVDEGWAALLPDPALSTGYGLDFIQRGWGRWGDVAYGDLMSAVDGALERAEIDAGRTVAMGGSFGGYMANWIAGHTDRFDALVTHASLWALDSFHGATDLGVFWEREFGDPYTHAGRYREHSPHLHVADVKTPMLVIHGELDYRVPIGEALRLWTDLKRHDVPAEFLYFPDENHWIMKPNNIRIWYQTVLGFIDHHARGEEWKQPELL